MNIRTCSECKSNFSIEDWDISFYDRIKVPPPTLCSNCRLQRKLAHHNQINLYKRKCDASGESIISHFPPNSLYQVYNQKHWWGDTFDPIQYGQDFDFSRPFFEQYHELSLKVPRVALMTDYLNDENCPYTNFSGRNKDCYLIFDSDESWDCYYSYTINGSRNTSDAFRVKNMELCYEAIDSKDCYGSSFIYNCDQCRDSWFLESCIGCKNCIMCCNLRQKEFYIKNNPVSREDFETFRRSLSSYAYLCTLKSEFEQFIATFPRRSIRGFHNENVTGDYLVHCKNANNCFDCLELWDGKYCYQGFMPLKDCMDCEECGEGELLYECSNLGYNAYSCIFSHQCLNQISNLIHCDHCFNGCSDLFGCIGLRREKYCILNKQYSKKEYDTILPRIIQHMTDTAEWGEFLPMKYSTFPYNLTMAQEQFTLTKEKALARGLLWADSDEKQYTPQTFRIPDTIAAVTNNICQEILSCINCRKNFKLIPQELSFYKQLGIPVPRNCFFCRNETRRTRRNPRKLFQRFCEKCGVKLQTTYSPERPYIVYCETCFADALE